LERTAKPIREPPIKFKVDIGALRGLALHLLARNGDGSRTAGKLALAFGQPPRPAKVGANLENHITPAASPRAAPVSLDERPFPVRHTRPQNSRGASGS
jgi:hypothetical protein